jgi:ATP-dependent RNA helicase DDX18/HAS1
MGGGSGVNGRSGMKRKRDGVNEADTEDVIGESTNQGRSVSRSKTKGRRKEQLGGKKIDKEIYRNKRPKGEENSQWSR